MRRYKIRRIEYSMKVKHFINKKRCKYYIKKVITKQKWIRGFLFKNLLKNIKFLKIIIIYFKLILKLRINEYKII